MVKNMGRSIQVLALVFCIGALNARAGDAGGSVVAIGVAGSPRGAVFHSTVETMGKVRQSLKRTSSTGTSPLNMSYNGGYNGVGVETAPKIYLILWGNQWNNNDPSGEAPLLQSFFSTIGASPWLNSVTQYCQGVAKGTTACNGLGTAAGNQAVMFTSANVWIDNAAAAPTSPTQNQIATEALNAAAHFGNTTATGNASVLYVVATAKGKSMSGFGSQWCAWHSAAIGTITVNSNPVSFPFAYTYFPYMTDAGANCGAGFNGLGSKAGITMVAGHEIAETITDQWANYGWYDANGAENGDKCAWIKTGSTGASQNLTFPNSLTYPVQSLWSNVSGSCALTY